MIFFRFPGIEHVACAFSTRHDGNVSLDLPNDGPGMEGAVNKAQAVRHSLLQRFGAFAEVKQVHGTRTIFEPPAQNPDFAATDEGDGVTTSQQGLALMIKTADCQPILLAHKSGRFVAALHVGWRGNRANYPASAVRELCQYYGVLPEELSAVRGPSLGPSAAEFINFQSEWGPEFAPWFQAASQCMNLWALTRYQLEQAGLRPDRIFSLDLCTWSLPDDFFSYRRFCAVSQLLSQPQPLPRPAPLLANQQGRQGSFIWREY